MSAREKGLAGGRKMGEGSMAGMHIDQARQENM